ncbi:MAG TPA: DUF1203 domain-containing protein [Candidatus Acidoferrales bacterium]|nr:DUF1203 domain-containing protein [Candidatus Acidoferrales bacterium]
MGAFRVVAIPTETAREVRRTKRSPFHDLPVHSEIGRDDAPCRHCLRSIRAGEEERILCTYDRFSGVESLPQPGPIYVHGAECARYAEDGGFPEEFRESPRTLESYGRGRKLLAREHVADGQYEPVIAAMLANGEADYILVNSTTAGCFTFRIERV